VVLVPMAELKVENFGELVVAQSVCFSENRISVFANL